MSKYSSTYSRIEQLNNKAKRAFESGSSGSYWLTSVIILSGILSAIFFWHNSQLVFSDIQPPEMGLLLGLLVGLVPAEGAFFGWKHVRGTKVDLTKKQVKATTVGLFTAVACSVFSTFALFVASFEYVPESLQELDTWLVFLALSIPLVAQVIIYSVFAIGERTVEENKQHAELSAMGFDAWMKMEKARIQAIIDGAEAELDNQLESYGATQGRSEASRILGQSAAQLIGGEGGNQSNDKNQIYGIEEKIGESWFIHSRYDTAEAALEALNKLISAFPEKALRVTNAVYDRVLKGEYRPLSAKPAANGNGHHGHGGYRPE